MNNNSFYLLWLPKYFDEYYALNTESGKGVKENNFLTNLKEFLNSNANFSNIKLTIHDKKIPKDDIEGEIVKFQKADNSIGYWGEIEFKTKNILRDVKIVFNEFGFYYFEFSYENEEDDKKIIQSFFTKQKSNTKDSNKKRYFYPLLTESQEEVLKETFLNDHLNYEDFNRKQQSERKVKLEDFILEACYKADEKDVNINDIAIQNKFLKLKEYNYHVKNDEYYNFNLIKESQEIDNDIYKIYKKIYLDCYEEQAITTFLNTVVSAKYFDRITKSIKEVREGLTGKIIFMTPQDTKAIDNKYQNNKVFHKWSEEKIENYVQLLISKKPLFMKIDNALKSAYYITIGNVSSLGHINEKEDISQLLYYNEWSALLGYFMETTKSLNNILNLYHSNRTYNELEEIKHYESNNHDKDDIDLLIKSNENTLGVTEDSKAYMMIATIGVAILVALPDMISSVERFPNTKFFNLPLYSICSTEGSITCQAINATMFYSLLVFIFSFPFRNELKRLFPIFIRKFWKDGAGTKYIKTASDDFDILEHRSNTTVKSFDKDKGHLKKVSINYQEHISTHRFARHIEALKINPCEWSQNNQYRLLPEIATIENMKNSNKRLYNHIKQNRTTKFSVNRIDKTKIKITLRYRVNRIKINDFLDYYVTYDSYIKFYKQFCNDKKHCYYSKCSKINSQEIVKKLKEDFKGIDAEFSFVAIYAFTLNSKTLNHEQKKEFELYKDSFRVYFHIDKYPIDYYSKEFQLVDEGDKDYKLELKPYDAISEMVYLIFLGRLKGFNYNMKEN